MYHFIAFPQERWFSEHLLTCYVKRTVIACIVAISCRYFPAIIQIRGLSFFRLYRGGDDSRFVGYVRRLGGVCCIDPEGSGRKVK